MLMIFKMLFLLAACLINFPAFAGTIVSEEFDSDSAFCFWNVSAETCAHIQSQVAYSGKGALELHGAGSCQVRRKLMFHKSSDIVRNGFYTRFYCKLVSQDDSIALVQKTLLIFSLTLMYLDEKTQFDPFIYLEPAGEERYTAKIGVRDTLGASPRLAPAGFSTGIIDFSQWHCFEIFVSLDNDTLCDSLFVDDDFIAAQKTKLKGKAETFQFVNIGSDYMREPLPVRSIIFDHFTIATHRTGPDPRVPSILFPRNGASFIPRSPSFMLRGDCFTDSFEVLAVSENKEERFDSVFGVEDKCCFKEPFAGHTAYTVCGRAKNVFGSWSAWTGKSIFIASPDTRLFVPDSNFSISIGYSSSDSQVRAFYENDTVMIRLGMPAEVNIMYLLLNVSSERFSSDWEKRWNVFEPTRNFIGNVSLARGIKLYIPINGKWVPENELETGAPGLIAADLPVRLSGLKYAKNTLSAAFTLKPGLAHGIWYINAQFIVQGGKAYQAQSTFFRFEPPAYKKYVLPVCIFLVSCVFIVGILLLYRRKREEIQSITPAMIETSRNITSYLLEQHMHKLSNEDIGRKFGLTGHRAVAIFKAVTGITPTQKLMLIRIEKAKELLRTSVKSVTDIGYEVGYSDLRLFQRNFNKIAGMNPRDFRSKYKH